MNKKITHNTSKSLVNRTDLSEGDECEITFSDEEPRTKPNPKERKPGMPENASKQESETTSLEDEVWKTYSGASSIDKDDLLKQIVLESR